MILDGELVAADASGRPDFGVLQQRMHVVDPAAVRRLAVTVPVTFLAFDVLWVEGRSLLEETYDVRREALLALEPEHPWDVRPPSPATAPLRWPPVAPPASRASSRSGGTPVSTRDGVRPPG